MKHHNNHQIFKHNWFLNPLVGVLRTKMVKNEFGEDEEVFVTGVERRDKSPTIHTPHDFAPYLQIRSMLTGNGDTTRTIIQEATKTYGIYSKKKNILLNFEHASRTALPILGTKTTSRTTMGTTDDVSIFKEKQAVSLLANWFVSAMRSSTKNLPKKSGKALGTEVYNTGLLKNTSVVLKKRTAFYNELWNLYNMKDDEDPTKK